jgi:long-chain acyl-CoA synthetase
MNIGTLLPRHARFRAEHCALVMAERQWNFTELAADVNKLANALLNIGLKKGDTLVTVLSNRHELVLAYWAAAQAGFVMVPASPMLQASGLETLLCDCDAAVVIGEAGFVPIFDAIRANVPGVPKNRWIITGGEAPGGYVAYEKFLENASSAAPPAVVNKGDDIYNIMYSSGTTGSPKGIILTHAIRASYCTVLGSAFRMTPERIVLHAGSIVFNGAMLDFMPWMYFGCTYILHETFDAGRVIADIERHGVTHIVMVPAQFIALLNHPDYHPERFRSLEMILNVGAPLLLEYKKRLNEELPGRFYELYGLTEGFMTILDKHDAIRKEGSVGCPHPFYEMKILDEDGVELPPGEVGEICGRGPMLTPGYYKRDDLTKVAIRDGWMHTGDAGYVDEDGYLFLVDRIKDMIITGGVNVYPHDIEEVIIQHGGVREVAVIGVPDEKWGEVPVAAIIPEPGVAIDMEQLITWTNERVGAKYQRVRDGFVLDEFPRNVAAKTLKREIIEIYLKKRTRCPDQ